MPQTMSEIVSLLNAGTLTEHRYPGVELKEDWAQDYGKKLSGLANRFHDTSSWIIIGVSDEGHPAGKQETWARAREQVISQQINDFLDPIQAASGIQCAEIQNSWVIIIAVKNPGDVVYWNNCAYYGAGTTIKAMNPEEVLKIRIQLPGLADYSKQTASSTYNEDLINIFLNSVSKTESYSEALQQDHYRAFCQLGIQDKQVARILFGNCAYRVVKYSRGEPVENSKHCGLFRLLTDEFINEIEIWTAAQLTSNEEPYSRRALKEALANAVAHAAYFENDGDIIVELFSDKVLISNLSVRESIYFANRWFSRSHKTINGLLVEILRVGRFMDELGRGKNLIFSESIRRGKVPPEVIVEGAGRFYRWKLCLYGGTTDIKSKRLLTRIKDSYQDEQKALIACSLVLWRSKPVTEIRNYIDGDFSRQFAEVLADSKGPIFYYREKDSIILRRWAKILLGEGKDSKAFSPDEEKDLLNFVYDIQTKYHDGYVSPKMLRDLAAMGETKSERVLSSKLLSSWEKKRLVKKVRRGQYKFVPKAPPTTINFDELVKLFKGVG